jgi:hypothetical protein
MHRSLRTVTAFLTLWLSEIAELSHQGCFTFKLWMIFQEFSTDQSGLAGVVLQQCRILFELQDGKPKHNSRHE